MQTEILLEIYQYIKSSIDDKELIKNYNMLLELLLSATNNSDEELSKKIIAQKQKIIDIQASIEPTDWNYYKSKSFNEFNKKHLFGIQAIEKLNILSEENQANPLGFSNEIKNIIDEINNISNKSSFFISEMSSLENKTFELDYSNQNAYIYIFFENDALVETINDIEKYSRIWENILRTFSRLVKESENVFFVEYIEKEFLLLRICPGENLISSLSNGTINILESYKKILQIRKLQLEILSLNLNNEISVLLDEEIDLILDKSTKNTVIELMELYKWQKEPDLDDVFSNVQKSFKQILNFIEKGGKIECFANNSDDIKINNSKILQAFDEVKDLEKKINEISSKQHII